MSVNHSDQDRRHNRDISLSFSDMKVHVCCVFSLESPHRGNSNEYTQYTIFNIKKKSCKVIPNTILSSAVKVFLLGTQE